MAVMQNFELASRSVPNRSYEARRKPRPLIENLRYIQRRRGGVTNKQPINLYVYR